MTNSLHANEAYLDHYDLNHDPFADRVPGFKFFSAKRKTVLGQLHHLARYQKQLLVVCGPQGSGKSLLRQALVASTNKQVVKSIAVSAKSSADLGIINVLARELSLRTPASIVELCEQLQQLEEKEQELYFLIDDAEFLHSDDLQDLLELAISDKQRAAHVFLFAKPEVVPELEAVTSSFDDLISIVDLEPYDKEETCQYMEQRLEGAGSDLSIFHEENLSDIYRQSEGWPGSINQIARDTLIDEMLASRNHKTPKTRSFSVPKKYLLILLVVLLGFLVAWLMQGKSKEKAHIPSKVVNSEQNSNGQNATITDGLTPLPNVHTEASKQEETDNSTDNNTEVLPSDGTEQSLSLPSEDPEGSGLTAKDEDTNTDNKSNVTSDESSNVLVDTRNSNANKPTPTPKPVVKSTSVASAGDSAWYVAQPSSNYTLQVLGTSNEAKARTLTSQYGSKYHYFQKQYQGKSMYVVTYGSFASADLARSSVRQLPSSVMAGHPWPKSIAAIKSEMTK